MIDELETVILETDVPNTSLRRGDVGTVVLVHEAGAAYEVEFVTLDGTDMIVVTLEANQIRPTRSGEVARARTLDRQNLR